MKRKGWIMALILTQAVAALAAPRAALFVQNRAGASMEDHIDTFRDLLGSRLSGAGVDVVRSEDVLARFTESRRAEEAQTLRQAVEALQTWKAEGTVDGPSQEASALRIAQLLDADYLVMASLVSLGTHRVRSQSYGLEQEAATTTLRLAVRILEGETGAQILGDTISVSDKVVQTAHLRSDSGDQVFTLLDRGANELADRVGTRHSQIAAGRREPAELATVTLNTSAAGAAVEIDGVVIGTAPGTFQIRPGIHEVRVTREGYATWEKTVAFQDGQVLDIPLEFSGVGLARKGELEEQARIDAIAREQSAAEARARTVVAEGAGKQMSESYIRLEGMPEGSLSIGDSRGSDAGVINVIQQEVNQ